MSLTNEQLGVRVDRVEERLATVENNMATKGDIASILDALKSFESKSDAALTKLSEDTAGIIDLYNNGRFFGRVIKVFGDLLKWVGGIFAAVVSAYLAWRALR